MKRRSTKKQMKEWLDDQVLACQLQHKELSLGGYDKLSNWSAREDGVHIGRKAVTILADIFDLELVSKIYDEDDPRYKYLIYFTYKDVKFYGIESEEEHDTIAE